MLGMLMLMLMLEMLGVLGMLMLEMLETLMLEMLMLDLESIGDVGNIEDIGDVGDSGGNVEDIGDVGDVDVAQLPSDPGLRVPIQNYDVNIRDHPTWLEYSIAKDAIFCFYFYLFSLNGGSFVKGVFSNWKKKEYIRKLVGASSSAHNQARVEYELFKNQEQSTRSCLVKQSYQARTNYRIRLNASIDCVRFLLQQRMTFRGYDESEDSNNQGNFLELLHWLCDHNPEIKAVTLTNAPENLKLTSPRVQKNIVSAIASECLHVIIENVHDSFFLILVDESRDISVKGQMSVVIRFVKNGCILEHFIGVIHVLTTTAASLKAAIDQLFSTQSLSISNWRGRDMMELVTCEKHPKIETFFTTVHRLVNIVGGSAERSDLIRENQRLKILESLSVGEISSGRVDVIEMIATDTTSTGTRGDACILLELMLRFEFAFNLHLMKRILGISNELSRALQRKDQDIAML
ncbi:zinc finger MYM-type protein 1-like [Olea europaea var. sylvestris]|uniref:zinc finger MYM-type protein 1-like n=1 Tax=Olea europaea var. sylvestris TaxID=158386 RepID=UPI000C1D4794|nr:zinc finger MYM-type protein 1-like [Olea europaea var. sylvestris]